MVRLSLTSSAPMRRTSAPRSPDRAASASTNVLAWLPMAASRWSVSCPLSAFRTSVARRSLKGAPAARSSSSGSSFGTGAAAYTTSRGGVSLARRCSTSCRRAYQLPWYATNWAPGGHKAEAVSRYSRASSCQTTNPRCSTRFLSSRARTSRIAVTRLHPSSQPTPNDVCRHVIRCVPVELRAMLETDRQEARRIGLSHRLGRVPSRVQRSAQPRT